MKKEKIIVVRTSCDDAFINRVAQHDPFEYWNRCIAPGTSKGEFNLEDEVPFKLVITKKRPFNYEIVYPYVSDVMAEALIIYHGVANVQIIEVKEAKELPVITIEQARNIEDKVLAAWDVRAIHLNYNPKHKRTIQLQAEFLLGMVAVTDILTNAATTKESSVSPNVYLSIIRGEYVTINKTRKG